MKRKFLILTILILSFLTFIFLGLTGCNAALAKSIAAGSKNIKLTSSASANTEETAASKDTNVTSTETTENTKNIYHITSSSNTGGTISPQGDQSVKPGSDITFTITPDSGYKLDYLRVDNDKLTNIATTYTFKNVVENHTIDAHFVKK
ncbi:MAG: hypothetical protein M1409_01835 [Actinobacteria bacterium]|nr:hypothetical protein [Actinomycetota bacterium]